MKNHILLFVSLIAFIAGGSAARAKDFDDAHRFIFYAFLEGCYEDGVSTEDVGQMLLKRSTNYFYVHFIYACPVCTPTVQALEAYQSRPEQFYSQKKRSSTFGAGLTADLKTQLYSAKPEDQLAAINTLLQRWVARRITMLRLSTDERAQLQKKLEAMRKEGMKYLKSLNPKIYPMSAFTNVQQCAVCNGACGMNLIPPKGK